MFEKLLSSIGIGSAKVNTILFDNKIERGKEVKGEVHVFGGKAEQLISEIYIHVDTEFHKDDDDTEFWDITEPILEIKITDPIVIKPSEEKVIPFSFILPYYTPITFNEQKIHIQTELDINFFSHPIETHDFIVVDPLLDDIIAYFTNHGFKHNSNSGLCRHKLPTDDNPSHCLQTFYLINDKNVKVHFIGNYKDIDIYVSDKEQISHFSIKRDKDIHSQLSTLREKVQL